MAADNRQTRDDGLTFVEWMRRVDREIGRKAGGLSHMDLADYAYRDAYDDGESAADVAVEVLADNGWSDGFGEAI